jgi:hypothetical protein
LKTKFLKKLLSKRNLKQIANPSAFCLVLFLLQIVFLKTILCLFQVKFVKKLESVTHIWARRGSRESVISSNSKIVAIPTISVGQFVPQRPLFPQVAENGVAGHFALPS